MAKPTLSSQDKSLTFYTHTIHPTIIHTIFFFDLTYRAPTSTSKFLLKLSYDFLKVGHYPKSEMKNVSYIYLSQLYQ
jgi:hypothetical protein